MRHVKIYEGYKKINDGEHLSGLAQHFQNLLTEIFASDHITIKKKDFRRPKGWILEGSMMEFDPASAVPLKDRVVFRLVITPMESDFELSFTYFPYRQQLSDKIDIFMDDVLTPSIPTKYRRASIAISVTFQIPNIEINSIISKVNIERYKKVKVRGKFGL